MRVTFLGTGTAVPHPERGPTALLLRNRGCQLVVDAGSGTLQKLAQAGANPWSVDAWLLSHAHLDHIADLFPLLFALYIPGLTRAKPLRIGASAGTMERVCATQTAFGDWLRPASGQVEWQELAARAELDLAGLRVRALPVLHHASSLGFRIEAPEGQVVAIPADTGLRDEAVELCRDADLAVLECSCPDDAPLEKHLAPRDVAEIVRRSRARRVAIVHRYPLMLAGDAVSDVARACDADVFAPNDLDSMEIPPGNLR